MKPQFLLIFLLALIFSCQNKDNQAQNSSDKLPSYKLETLDSVTVHDILARSFLFQSADKDYLIFRDVISSEIFVFDKEGRAVDKWSKTGDMPGKFSFTSGQMAQDKSGNLVVLDIMNGLKVFKKNGDIVQNFGLYQSQWSLGASLTHFKSYQVIEKNGKEYLLYSLDVIEEPSGEYGPEFLQTRKNLILTDLETEDTKTFLQFPQGSQFLNGNVYLFEDFRPVFTYDEESQLLYLVFHNEPILYTYDWSGSEPILKEKSALNLDGFVVGEGFEKGIVGFPQISDYKISPYPSHIVNLEKYGSDIVISYKPTPADKGDLAIVKTGEASKELKAKLAKETKIRTVIFTQNGDIVPLTLPEMNAYNFSVIGEDIWWMKKYTGEEEQEDFTVYRGRLVKE